MAIITPLLRFLAISVGGWVAKDVWDGRATIEPQDPVTIVKTVNWPAIAVIAAVMVVVFFVAGLAKIFK